MVAEINYNLFIAQCKRKRNISKLFYLVALKGIRVFFYIYKRPGINTLMLKRFFVYIKFSIK